MQDQTDIAALESRIAAAFERIGKGIDRLGGATSKPAAGGDAALEEALEAERNANAQLKERLRAVKDGDAGTISTLEARVEELTKQLDVQGIELQRLKKTTVQLRETLRAQTDALAAGVAEPQLINRSMLAELEALRAQRLAEVSEMEAVLAEIGALVSGTEGHDA